MTFELGTDDEVPARLAQDEFYRALADRKRRRVLAYLLRHDSCSDEELADVICGWETEPGGMAPVEQHRNVLALLRHVDLPILDDAGLLSYDRSRGTVSASSLQPPIEWLILSATA